jgi:hypothetical protein
MLPPHGKRTARDITDYILNMVPRCGAEGQIPATELDWLEELRSQHLGAVHALRAAVHGIPVALAQIETDQAAHAEQIRRYRPAFTGALANGTPIPPEPVAPAREDLFRGLDLAWSAVDAACQRIGGIIGRLNTLVAAHEDELRRSHITHSRLNGGSASTEQHAVAALVDQVREGALLFDAGHLLTVVPRCRGTIDPPHTTAGPLPTSTATLGTPSGPIAA